MNLSKRVVCGFVALGLCLAMAAPTFGASDIWDPAGVDELWSNPANWDTTDGGQPLPSIKTVIGEYNYGIAGANDCTLDIEVSLPAFEVYGKGVLDIVDGGILTLAEGGDRGIYVNGDDAGSRINLLPGGQLILENPQDGFNIPAEVYTPGGSLVTVDAGGYTTYTNSVPVPEPGTMSLLAIGGLGLLMLRRRRRA